MKKVAVAVLAMALLIPMLLAVPVMAAPPTKGTYTQVIIGLGVSAPKEWLTGDVLHAIGGVAEYYIRGAPFPLGNSISSSTTSNFELNTVSLTGNFLGHAVDNFAAGTVEGTLNAKFSGGGVYVYLGPTFTFTLGTKTATLTTGDVFGGLLYDVLVVKHGTGDLAGFTIMGTSEGVSISAVLKGDPNMAGLSLDFETGTYSGHL